MASFAFLWTKGTDFFCGLKCERADSTHSWGSSCVKQAWCGLVRVLAASVLVGRFLVLSGKGWDNPGFGTPWDLSDVGYVSLDLIPGGKSLFPHSNANWKSLVQEKQKELDHVVIVMDESTTFTADEDDVTFSSAASNTPTPLTSQARKHERPPLSPGRPGPYPV